MSGAIAATEVTDILNLDQFQLACDVCIFPVCLVAEANELL